MKSFLAVPVITLAFLGQSVCAEDNCHFNSIVGMPSDGAAIRLSDVKLVILPTSSNASVLITSQDVRPINAVFLVLNFYKSKQYQLSISFHMATSGVEPFFKTAVPRSALFNSPAPLPASLLRAQNYRPSDQSTLRPTMCPDEIRLGVLQIAFADGTTLDIRMPGWRIDPTLLSIEPWVVGDIPATQKVFFGRLSVSEDGRVRVVAMGNPASQSDAETSESDLLVDKIEHSFRYAPAMYGGLPISSELNLVVRLLPSQSADPFVGVPSSWITPAASVLDITSSSPGKNYELIYGGFPFVGQERK